MKKNRYDVIVIGGSVAGLSAAMASGRALRNVLVVDGGKPANRFTPNSHNFITHDGRPPAEIISLAKYQVQQYRSVDFKQGMVTNARVSGNEFFITIETREMYVAKKIILATGIIDLLPEISGLKECWGKSVLHCPYCHGYEVRGTQTAILGNGDYAFEFGAMISNWTDRLAIYTNGTSTLTREQTARLMNRNITVTEDKIERLIHDQGYLKSIVFQDGRSDVIDTLYTRPEFIHHSDLSEQLKCEMNRDGYIRVDGLQRTSVPGVFACGDNASKIRTVANAVAMGTTAGMMSSKELILEDF